MATTEVLLYTIVILVILMKLMFWSFYFCLRNRRQHQLRRRQAEAQTRAITQGVICYEEEPAVPQPAFVFAGIPGNIPETALVGSLPEYQSDDPYKRDNPPPSYGDLYTACEEVPNELDECSEVVSSDTDRLISGSDSTRQGHGSSS